MAFRYLIYSTGTTFTTTIVRESAINNPGANEASYWTDFMIPEIQPLYLWRVDNAVTPTAVIPNIDANINEYLDSIAPPHTPNDVVLWDDLTGITSQKIDKVTGATVGNIATFIAGGNVEDSGYSIADITGGTTGSGVTWSAFWQYTGDTYVILTGLTADINYISGVTSGLSAQMGGKLDIATFTGYTATTQPILDAALTGATDAGTGTTLISSVSGRTVYLKTISVVGGLELLGDGDNIIISGQTGGGLTGVTWNDVTSKPAWITGNTAQEFASGHTHPQYLTGVTGYVTIGEFTGYTAQTYQTLTGITADITYISGVTSGLTAQITGKLDTSVFTGYTATTQLIIDGKIDKLTGATQNNIVIFGVGGEVADSGVQIRTDVRPLSASTDSYVPTEQAVREAINNAISGYIILQGDWNASTNIPNLTGITGNTGFAWRVSVSGTTNLGGITDWQVGDLAVKTAGGWLKIDNSEISAVWGNIDGDIWNQTDLWQILTGTTAATATKLDTQIFTNYTGATQPIIDAAITGATNGLHVTGSGRDVALGGDLTGSTIISGIGLHDLYIANINEFQVSTNGGVTGVTFGLDKTGILLDVSGTTVSLDGNAGLEYGNDYSSGFTARSLVDVEYVSGLTSGLQADIDYISGVTDTKLNISTFTGYTASTNAILTGITADIDYISGVTDANYVAFTGYTASTKNKDKKIVLISSAVTNVNTVASTPIPWATKTLYDRTGAVFTGTSDTYLWTGGTSVWILESGVYEVQYHVTLANGTGASQRSVGGYLALNTTTTIDETATATNITTANSKAELSLPLIVMSFNANDKLDLIGFRISNSGTVNTVLNSVFLVINRLA